jgi:glycerophosphoryl diester phosphodiesterase
MLPAIYAYRLGGRYGPDPSRAALSRTLERRVDGLETDCCLTADDDVVLLHDPLLQLGTGLSGWAHQRTAAEICAGRLRDRTESRAMSAPFAWANCST